MQLSWQSRLWATRSLSRIGPAKPFSLMIAPLFIFLCVSRRVLAGLGRQPSALTTGMQAQTQPTFWCRFIFSIHPFFLPPWISFNCLLFFFFIWLNCVWVRMQTCVSVSVCVCVCMCVRHSPYLKPVVPALSLSRPLQHSPLYYTHTQIHTVLHKSPPPGGGVVHFWTPFLIYLQPTKCSSAMSSLFEDHLCTVDQK